jgi:FkbM family methyltransferase
MISYLAGAVCNTLITRLRNGKQINLTREQIRSSNISFSQFGEDLLILTYFPQNYQGFYMDVGAFHPFKLSNTMLLYKTGWSGLVIDSDQSKIMEFIKQRPRDLSLCESVADSNKEMIFYRYPLSATNRLHGGYDGDVNPSISLCGELPIEKKKVLTKTLEQICDENNISGKKVDFLNIDVEGLEIEVLHGNNFKKISPSLICVEIMDSVKQKIISEFLSEHGYQISDTIRHNVFFKKDKLHIQKQ